MKVVFILSKFFERIGMGTLNLLVSAPYFIRTTYITAVMSGFSRMLVDAMDYRDSAVRGYAQETISAFPEPYNIGQVCLIHDRVSKEFVYTGAVAIEGVRSAREQVLNGFNGDCEDYAVLVCALVRAIGGSVRLICALSSDSGHVYPEVFIGDRGKIDAIADFLSKFYKEWSVDVLPIYLHRDPNNKYWINLDMGGYVGWELYHSTIEIAVYPNGNYNEIYKS